MKKLKKKLMLNKHTVTNLRVNEMRAIAGGNDRSTTWCTQTEETCSLCYSYCNTEVPKFCGSDTLPCTETCNC
jgi:hypothetical protein